MAIHVEIISREMIKPSSPTPSHLKTLKLSFLDQISPPIYIPLIFFYNHDQLRHKYVGNHVELSRCLKRSLSDVLTNFYPLGGRIQENSSTVDCDDCGAEFIEARVCARLSDVIRDPNMEDIKKLQPLDPLGQDEKVVLAVKISFFNCGGVAIAICLSHKVGDGTSLATFVNAWAAPSRGQAENFQPVFDFASIFPPRPLSNGLAQTPKIGVTNEKLITKRFVFNKEKIANIKECFATESQVKEPTRVEAVSAYIWRRFMAITKAKARSERPSFAALHAVNLRARANPPLPQNMFGNCWRPVIALSKSDDDDSDLVTSFRSAIRSADADFVRRVQNGEYLNHLSRKIDLYFNGGLEFCNFSSWCRFPLYKVDFGWGKPDWVCTTTLPYKNVVILMSSPCGEGIEAWVNMLEDDMKMFEQDQKVW